LAHYSFTIVVCTWLLTEISFHIWNKLTSWKSN